MLGNHLCHICDGLVDLINLQPSGVRLCDCEKRLSALRAYNKKLKAELTEAKKYAERYRWLRDSSVGPSQIWELLSDDCNPPIMTLKSMHELDAAIDEAMKGK